MSFSRAVFDTNIFLSALLFDGNPGLVLEMVRAGKIQLIVSPAILTELSFILKSKFSWDDEDIREALMAVGRIAVFVKPAHRLRILADDADNRVLECALEGGADCIISGDHHLLKLGEFRGVPILRASDFLKEQT